MLGDWSLTGLENYCTRLLSTGQVHHFTCTGCNYDNNGNLINDGPVPPGNTYSWDAEGNLSQFNSGGAIIYDALGRRVEQPGTQIVYGSGGPSPKVNGDAGGSHGLLSAGT